MCVFYQYRMSFKAIIIAQWTQWGSHNPR